MNKPIEIVVGGTGPYDPAVGTTDCVIPILAGTTQWVEKTGFGTYDYTKYSPLSGGGFRLVGVGNVFGHDERFYVHYIGVAYNTDSTNYSNGFNLDLVMAALFGRIGWRQPTMAGSPVLNSANLLTKSGRVFQEGFHALVTVANAKAIMEEPGATDQAFNSYLEGLQRSIILKAVTSVFNQPEFLTQGLLFDRTGENDQVIVNGNNFVGYRLKVPPVTDIALQIDSVSLYFDRDVTFDLYLFQDNRKTPVWIQSVSAIGKQQTVINLPDLVLNYITNVQMGGSFYIGYFQTDLGSAQAFDEQRCRVNRYPFGWEAIESPKNTGEYDFDRVTGRSSRTYGLNLNTSTFRDHTQQIVRKAALFDNLIGLQMAAMIIEETIYTTRSNSTERGLKDGLEKGMAYMDLNNAMPVSDAPRVVGLQKKMAEELARVRKGFFPGQKTQTVSLC